MLSTAQAHAVQISLSGDNIDRYFRILEHYVLPLMVVSTIVLFCGYIASRIYHRTAARDEDLDDPDASRDDVAAASYDGTAAFLRELRATPPIEDAEPKREPRLRAQHPLLRRRAANAAAALRAHPVAPEDHQPAPAPEPPAAANALRFDRPPPPQAHTSPERGPAPRAEPPARFDPPGMFEPEPEPAPTFHEAKAMPPAQAREFVEESLRRTEAEDLQQASERRRARGELFVDSGLRAGRVEEAPPPPPAESRDQDRSKLDPPPIAMTSNWWQDADEPARAEPSASVVQSLKAAAGPSSAEVESARAKAGEIGDRLDYAAGVLQQSATLLAERMQLKQGLAQDEVRSMRIAGFEHPQGIEEDLRKLGGDVAQEAMSALGAVANFDNVLRRLEQMAEAEPLDEGWNDLLRTRISDTLYQVGQVRKTLGGYRVAAKKPARSSDKHARPGGASGGGPDRPVPVGRRQV